MTRAALGAGFFLAARSVPAKLTVANALLVWILALAAPTVATAMLWAGRDAAIIGDIRGQAFADTVVATLTVTRALCLARADTQVTSSTFVTTAANAGPVFTHAIVAAVLGTRQQGAISTSISFVAHACGSVNITLAPLIAGVWTIRDLASSAMPARRAHTFARDAWSAASTSHGRPDHAINGRVRQRAVRCIASSTLPARLALAKMFVASTMTRAEVRADLPLW
jgi:hypothetical protein